VLAKYVALQVPGWIALVAVLGFARWMFWVPGWVVWAGLLLLVAKDAAIYPFIWRSFAASADDAPHPRVGTVGVVDSDLAPSGYVRVRGELWRATIAEREQAAGGVLPAGARVRVEAVRGLELIVCGVETRAPVDSR
jgi:membrane protein implicated in regulation of membrane protease activity